MTDQTHTQAAPPPVRRALTFGIVGVLAIGVAPLNLGRLAEVGRISAEMIGIAITAEFVGLALCAVLGGWVIGKGKSNWRIAATLALVAAANFTCAYVSGSTVAWARLVTGFGGGMLIWCAVAAILRTDAPERLSGIFVTAQTVAQFCLAIAMTVFLLAQFGTNAGYIALGLAALICMPITLNFPDIRPMTPDKTTAARLPLAAWLGLLSIGFFMALLNAIIAYAEPQLIAAGVPPETALNVFTLVLAVQIVAGTLASLLSERLKFTPAIAFVYVCLGTVIAGIALSTNTHVLLALYALFGFSWLFVAPFHVGFLLALDPTRRAAEFSPAAQLTGLALGPLLAAAQLTDADTVPPSLFWLFLSASLALFVLALVRAKRNPQPA